MILIDFPMPQNCYECSLMTRCDECEGYHNRCPLDDLIDCGYVVRRGTVVIQDRSNLTLWSRPERCPLKEVMK